MNISSLSLNTSASQVFSANNKKITLNFDATLAQETNYPTKKDESNVDSTQSIDGKSTINAYEQFVYAPNISALFSAYLDKQKLDQTSDSKKKELAEKLTSNGMDKNIAKNYAENGVELYKQLMEAQLRSKINGEVQKQDELQQKLGKSNTPNPYLQMTGSLISLYS